MSTRMSDKSHGNVATYTIGFMWSVLLTLAAYTIVQIHVHSGHVTLSHQVIIPLIAILALAQFFIQLFFFLHLGSEAKPRWKLVAFGFMTLVVVILVVGSLWIMNNLNYHMSSPTEVNKYLNNQDGL